MIVNVYSDSTPEVGTIGYDSDEKQTFNYQDTASCADVRTDAISDYNSDSWSSVTDPASYLTQHEDAGGGDHSWTIQSTRSKPEISGLDDTALTGAELWYLSTNDLADNYRDFTGDSRSEWEIWKEETFTGGATSYKATDYKGGEASWYSPSTCSDNDGESYGQRLYPIWVLKYELPDPP